MAGKWTTIQLRMYSRIYIWRESPEIFRIYILFCYLSLPFDDSPCTKHALKFCFELGKELEKFRFSTYDSA